MMLPHCRTCHINSRKIKYKLGCIDFELTMTTRLRAIAYTAENK